MKRDTNAAVGKLDITISEPVQVPWLNEIPTLDILSTNKEYYVQHATEVMVINGKAEWKCWRTTECYRRLKLMFKKKKWEQRSRKTPKSRETQMRRSLKCYITK